MCSLDDNNNWNNNMHIHFVSLNLYNTDLKMEYLTLFHTRISMCFILIFNTIVNSFNHD